MKNRIIKYASYVYFFVCFMVLLMPNVQAYIDPSVMTYTIQAVAGVAIAVGAFIGVYYRKIKKSVNKKLGIDENKNKEVESDDIIVKQDKNSK